MSRPIEYTSAEGTLRLYAEERGPADAPLTLLCMHGLTRNSKDFAELAQHLSARYRVVSADQRGRGQSQWDPNPANYQPIVYARDMFVLLDELAVKRVILLGTSMGGLMAMIMASLQPTRVQAVIINDIGPEIPSSGLMRLRDSLSSPAQINDWQDAARQAQRVNGIAFPDYLARDWNAFARRTYIEDPAGRPVTAFDPAILNGLRQADLSVAQPDLWPLWMQMSAIPVLAIRGLLSDILTAEVFEQMAARHPRLATVGVVNRGHAPMLDEPAALSAIDQFLDGLS